MQERSNAMKTEKKRVRKERSKDINYRKEKKSSNALRGKMEGNECVYV